jgi:hypothetical protein
MRNGMNCLLFRIVFSSTNPTKTGGELKCSGRVGSSCSTSDTRRINLVTNPSLPKQVLPFHSFINWFWFIPKNNTDADLCFLYFKFFMVYGRLLDNWRTKDYERSSTYACETNNRIVYCVNIHRIYFTRNNIHVSTKCVEFHLFLFVFRVYLCFCSSPEQYCIHLYLNWSLYTTV